MVADIATSTMRFSGIFGIFGIFSPTFRDNDTTPDEHPLSVGGSMTGGVFSYCASEVQP